MLPLLFLLLFGPLACKKNALPSTPERPLAGCVPSADGNASPEAAQRLLERLATASRQERFAITLSADELVSYLRWSTRGTPVQGMRLGLDAGEICLRAEVSARRTHRIALRFAPRAVAGRLQVRFRTASYDGHALPRIALATLEATLNAALADASLGIVVEQVTVNEGGIQLLCRRQ